MRPIEELIIDYLDKNLEGPELARFQAELEQNPTLKEEVEELENLDQQIGNLETCPPSKDLGYKLAAMLDKSIEEDNGKVIVMKAKPWKKYMVAASILICGVLLGLFYKQQEMPNTIANSNNQQNKNIQYVSTLLDEPSPLKRIQGIKASGEKDLNHQMIDLLIRTMKTDLSSNVRLAAVKALGQYTGVDDVRQAFVEALASEKDPAIKIELINIFSQSKDKRALDPLNDVIQNESDLKFVKDEAQKGILFINNSY